MVKNIEETLDLAEGDDNLFTRGRKRDFDIGEKEKLYTIWAGYLEHMIAFEGLTGYYGDFYLLKKRRAMRMRSCLHTLHTWPSFQMG